MLRILDETAAGGFNGVRLTGFPDLLERNGLRSISTATNWHKRGLRFSTVSFGGEYHDPDKHDEIRERARFALAAHRKFGATAMVFFPRRCRAGRRGTGHAERHVCILERAGKDGDRGIRRAHGPAQSHRFDDRKPGAGGSVSGRDRPAICFCAWDSAHLLLGGCDVVETYRKSIDRLVYTDFKDATLMPTADDYVAPNGRALRRRFALRQVL